MELRTGADIIHDMEGVILTRARYAELEVIRNASEGNVCVWNEYRLLLKKLNLLNEYLEVYG